MSPLAWVGLTILALPWVCTLVVVAFAVAVWWHRPRQRKPIVIPIQRVVRPEPNECKDCGFRQNPARTVCWICSGTRLAPPAEPSPHLWV